MLKKNIKRYVRVTFVLTYNTTKFSFCTSIEDRSDKLAHSHIALGVLKVILVKRKETFFERILDFTYKDNNSVVYNPVITAME